MLAVFWIVGGVAVLAVAYVAVGRTVTRLAAVPAPAVYQLDEAVAWIADHLPDEVTARVSYDEVAAVLRWQLDWLAGTEISSAHGEELGDEVVTGTGIAWADLDSSVDAVVARSLAEGGPDAVDVVCILDAQMRYLARIGAVDPVTDPPQAP